MAFTQYVTATQDAQTVPSAPMNVIATPLNGAATISWTSPNNTGGRLITGYTVSYGVTGTSNYTTPGCSTTGATSCQVSSLVNGQSYTFIVKASNATGTGPAGYSNAATPEPNLTASPVNLALAQSGASRSITFINTSGSPVTINSVTATGLPTGTHFSNVNCTGSLNANSTCTVTVTPGSTVSSDNSSHLCSGGYAPTPGASTVTLSTNAGTVTVNIYVLSYGCIYQSGYLFSMDDTTPSTSSIGGKVVTTLDQDQSNVIVWHSTQTSIWGIDDASTVGVPSPNTTSNQAATLSTGQLNCDAVNDGSCATNNIVVQYPSSLSSYAAGLCKQSINADGASNCSSGSGCYSDWYLPSVCELGPFGSDPTGNYPQGTNSQLCALGSTNIQNQLATGSIVTNFIAGYYWSSTEYSPNPQGFAWFQQLQLGGPGGQAGFPVGDTVGVRCVRALSL